MAEWSQSAFLQALGWATLNSFWQMALLWAAFVTVQHLFHLSSDRKFALAISGLATGFLWFIITFFIYLNKGGIAFAASEGALAPTSGTWRIILSSASLAYLLLLAIPAYRLFRNWRFVERLKKFGLHKTAAEHRLFVKKVALRLGIKKPVHLYISSLVTSPVTIGYLKPVILLPIAVLNSLTPQQVEAVLLHELSHIRRYDYLINLAVTFLQTLFYFNPFVKKFVAAIETEREKCCDELVLQFEYDKISYAAALLTLEKNAAATQALAIGATGKRHLLNRIEKIVGLEKKPAFSFNHFAGIMASVLLMIFINSLFFVNRKTELNKELASNVSFASFDNPFTTSDKRATVNEPLERINPAKPLNSGNQMMAAAQPFIPFRPTKVLNEVFFSPERKPLPVEGDQLVLVAYDATDALVTADEKAQITSTLEATKKVLTTTQWKEVEASIADGMTPEEKVMAKKEYMQEVEKLNWKNLEAKMKTEYNQMNWEKINSSLNQALVALQLDSMQLNYTQLLKQLEVAETQAKAAASCSATVLPVPDASVGEIRILQNEIRVKIDSIKVIRNNKKVISL